MNTKTKDQRVRAEKNRLTKLYRDLPESKKKLCAGLIERASFMRVELEDLEIDLAENGWAEPFQQSDKVDPYDRARPQGQTYNTLHGNYLKTIKQLDEMLPKGEAQAEDSFSDYLKRRSQL